MGNENSKSKELTQNGKIPEKHENGSVNGITESITSNGLEIGINGETVVQKNGGPLNLNLATELTEREYVIVESDSKHVDAPVITEILEADVQKEEVKKSKGEKAPLFGKMFKKKAEPPADVESVKENETSNEDQTDVSVPATDAQPESGSSGDKAATVIIAEQQKAEISTQTERKTETDISTQTGYDDDVTTTNTQCPVEEVFVMEAAATEEDLLNESAVVIAEEVVEETANEEPLDNQTSGIISEEVFIMETSVYENLVFRAERVEVIDNFEISYIKNCVPEGENVKETEPEIAAEPECDPNKSIIDGGVVAEKTVPLEVHFSLPKVVADCIEVVFTTVPESTDFVAVNTSDPSVDKVITEDHSEGARDMSPDVVLIETAKPESNAVTPEARETHGIPFQDKKPVTVVMETISVHVHEEPNPTPAYQDMPVEEPSVPPVTEVTVKVESAHEEVTADDAVAVQDVAGISEEIIIVEAPSSELITIEELIEDTLNFPDDEVKPEDVITTDEKAEVSEDVRADVGPETVKEAEPSPVIVKDDAEVIPEAAIKALSQELELSVIAPQEPAVDNGILLGEEVISATTFVPLSGDREASLTIAEEPIKTLAEEMNEEVIEALLNEFDVPPMDTTRERVEVTNIFEISHIKNCVPEGENVQETEPEIAAKPECDPNKSIIDGEIVAEEIVPLEFSFSLPKVVADCIEVVFAAVSESTDFADVNTSAQSVDEVITEDHDDGARDMSADVVLIEIPEPEALAEEMNKEAIKTLLKEFDVPPMGATEESESCVFVQEELVEENVVPSEELLEDSNKGTAVVAVKEPTDFNPVISEEPVEESASLLEPLVLVVILETREDEATEDTHETHNYRDVLVAIEENSEDCQIDTSYEAVAECVQVVLETIVEENITVDVATGCDLVTSELVAPEIIAEGEQEEHESNVNSTDSTQSAEIIEDMEALLVRLQSACTSVVLESAYRLGGLNISSLGYSINVTIHVTPKTEQQ